MESDDATFWLPSHFLTDDDFLPVSDHRHPREFDLLSSTFYPFGPESHNAKEKENYQCDDELLSELTRQLAHSSLNHSTHQKSWNLSTSPQSTLTGLSRNGESPPLTPPFGQNNVGWDLLYEAATEFARLKMAAQLKRHHRMNSSYNYSSNNHQVKRHGSTNTMWGHHQTTIKPAFGGFNTLTHSAWPNRVGPIFLGSGQPVKKQSTGTGVFIPRTHAEPRKNPPVPGVVGVMNVHHQHKNNGFFSNYGADMRITPTNAVIIHQRSGIRQHMPANSVGQDIRLPIDWTY